MSYGTNRYRYSWNLASTVCTVPETLLEYYSCKLLEYYSCTIGFLHVEMV